MFKHVSLVNLNQRALRRKVQILMWDVLVLFVTFPR